MLSSLFIEKLTAIILLKIESENLHIFSELPKRDKEKHKKIKAQKNIISYIKYQKLRFFSFFVL